MTAPQDSSMSHAKFATTAVEEAHAFISRAYSQHTPRVSGSRDDFRFRVALTQEPRFGVEFLEHTMRVRAEIDSYESLMTVHTLRGRISGSTRADEVRARAGEVILVHSPTPYTVLWEGIKVGMVRLDTPAVARFAAETVGGPIRFRLSEPISVQRARYWQSVVGHVTRGFLTNPAAMASPLLRTQVFHHLAAALLETFPVDVEPARRNGALAPAALRRATEFIDDHAHLDIGLTEIAEAARVSPRALQAAFRRHLDTTPLAYLRRVRLHRVHLELQAADPATGATVAGIATAWGFGHLGRFAADYRRCYGQPPRQTLHT